MALIPEIEGNILIIRSVGDHSIEEGVRDLTRAMELAEKHFQTDQIKIPILFDTTESKEERSADELRGVAHYFKPYLHFLSGKMAFYVDQSLHYGLTRVFAVFAESGGMEVVPFYDREEAITWLTR